MASGRNHDRSIYFATPIVLAIGWHYWGLETGIIAASAHFLGGYLLSPDLDQRGVETAPLKRWGWLKIIWHPYRRLIPRHRHWMSHAPVVGSAIRLLYLAAWLSLIWAVFSELAARLSPLWAGFPGLVEVQWAITWSKAIAFLAGVEMSALNHLLLDGLLVPLPQAVKNRLKG